MIKNIWSSIATDENKKKPNWYLLLMFVPFSLHLNYLMVENVFGIRRKLYHIHSINDYSIEKVLSHVFTEPLTNTHGMTRT